MASIFPGYEYDIFISYRQKDNKGDKWVNKFVDSLREELEATFKEDISIYFDENPHDRLQETHDVDKSLEGKLKCLIFIPILSQTYCDPNSYAWQYEYLAFNRFASIDHFEKNVKLRNGNYASRILPIRIHELEQEDVKLFEKETGSVLRAMDFVFKTASGVNRPLQSNEDRPNDNLNKTLYRDQINKVANSIKEIILALKSDTDAKIEGETKVTPGEIKTNTEKRKGVDTGIINRKSLKWIIVALLLLLCIIGGNSIYKVIKQKNFNLQPANLEKSIAVLPFRNLSNDSAQTYFCDGFMEEILNNLQRVNEFTVRSRTSTDQYRKTSKSIKIIGEEMNVNYLIEGSVGKEDNNLKIWVQLINAKTDSHVWANDYTSEMKQVFSLQSEIAKDIATKLEAILSPEEIMQIDKKPTESIEAYNLYLKGRFFWNKRTKHDLMKSITFFEEAIEIDTMFSLAYTGIADSYIVLGEWSFSPPDDVFPKAKEATLKAIVLDNNLAEAHTALAAIKRDYEWDWKGAENEYLKAIELKPNYPTAYQWYSEYLSIMGRDEEAIKELKYAQELEPLSPILYTVGGRITYYYSRQFDQALLQCQKALEIDSNYVLAHSTLAANYLELKMYNEAVKEIKKTFLLINGNPKKSMMLAKAYALSGRRNEAKLILNELINDSSEIYNSKTDFASLYLAFGWQEKALELLEEAYLNRDYGLIHINKSPQFDSLRSNPRFINILKKMGFME
jgi:adenylate cyclase